MPVSRRAFVAGVSSAASLAASGFLGEMRASGHDTSSMSSAPARILFNENPLGPSPKALSALSNAALQYARYPLGKFPQLESELRKRNGLPYTEVAPGLSLKSAEEPEGTHGLVLGVGSSEVLRAAAWAFCNRSGTIVEPYPSYAAIGGIAEGIPGSTIERVKVPLDGNHCLDTRAMIDAIDSNTRLVMICNPNNPTGTTIPVEEVEAIAAAAPSDALVFIDEAYIEFAKDPDNDSALEFAKTRSNVLISRTFSKIYGLAGLRIGYGISHVDVLEQLRPHLLGRLSFNMPGILAASAALEDQDHLEETLKLNETIHETWRKEFKNLGWRMTPSITCFCWLDLGHDCAPLVDFLANRGVLISGGQRWDLPNYVRISIGTEEENDRLIAGMKAFQTS